MVEIAAWIRSGPGWQHYSLLKAVAAVAGYVVIAGRRRAAAAVAVCRSHRLVWTNDDYESLFAPDLGQDNTTQ